MLSGMARAFVVCQAARSMISTACAPGATLRAISSTCACMASVLTQGDAIAAPLPRAGQIAPNSQAFW